MTLFQPVSLDALETWQRQNKSFYDTGRDIMTGGGPDSVYYTPQILTGMYNEALNFLGPAGGWGQDEIDAFEQKFVNPYLSSSNPYYQRGALSYLTKKAEIEKHKTSAQAALQQALLPIIEKGAPAMKAGWDQYAQDLMTLTSIDPNNPALQKAAKDFGEQGNAFLAPDTWYQTQAPLIALLDALQPAEYQGAGLPAIQTREPSALTPLATSQAYRDMYNYFAQFDPNRYMTPDYTGSHQDWRTDWRKQAPASMEQYHGAVVRGQAPTGAPPLYQTRPLSAEAKAGGRAAAEAVIANLANIRAGSTQPASRDTVIGKLRETGAAAPSVGAYSPTNGIKALMSAPDIKGPADAKAFMIDPATRQVHLDILEAFGGNRASRTTPESQTALMKIRAIIAKLDEYINKGYTTKWPSGSEV